MQEVTIKVKAITPAGANEIAKCLQELASNIDKSALQILAEKSKKPGMSDKVRKFKKLM